MDDIKDIQRTDSLTRFLDQHVVRTSPFGENRAADRAYRRAERMAAALHMLTAHIPDDEPVRRKIRNLAAELLSSVIAARGDMRSPQSANVGKVLSNIRYAISLVRLATVSGFVSVQNATIMTEALDELGSFVSAAQRSSLSEQVTLSREDLIDVGMTTVKQPVRRTIKPLSDKAAVKDVRAVSDEKAKSDKSDVTSQSVRELSVRVQNILDILRSGGSLGIRDISANLPEYSEKMIQRELLELVAQGKVVKSGLKRWSRYSLVA